MAIANTPTTRKQDNEAYRNTVKKQIQDWVNIVNNKKNQEWLIVYVTGSDSRGRAGRILNIGGIGGNVFEKLKSDFNTKKDRWAYERSKFEILAVALIHMQMLSSKALV